MCYIVFWKYFSSTSGINGIVKLGKKSTLLITCYYHVFKYIHCSSGNCPTWDQCTIMNFHGRTNTGSLWFLIVSTIQVTGCPIGLFSQSNYRAMCNWLNNWWWRRYRYSMFRVIFACGITCSHSFMAHLVSDMHRPNQRLSSNVYIDYYILFSKIRLGGTNFHMKPMPEILLFSASRDWFYIMWNFDWNPCLKKNQEFN